MLRLILSLMVALGLAACDASSSNTPERSVPSLPDVPSMDAVKENLAFTCMYEKDRIPPRDPEADQLYRRARWLIKGNYFKKDPEVYPIAARLLRIATAYGHDKANLELRELINKGRAYSDDPVTETIDLTQELIDRGIPGGYYDMGIYLESGYGVKQDAELALKYFRKAADLGSPQAQYLVGDKLLPVDMAPDVAQPMLLCAAEQGHGRAGAALGRYFKLYERFDKALHAFQLGVKGGDSGAASFLEHGFSGPPASDELYYLGQEKDPERVRRYEAIGHVLFKYDYLNPTVPEIDEIVPLPPAKLPPWDGKLKWLETHEANVPPPIPNEERIAEMARAKGLDPATGRTVLGGK